jgi:hypothetical protein
LEKLLLFMMTVVILTEDGLTQVASVVTLMILRLPDTGLFVLDHSASAAYLGSQVMGLEGQTPLF